MKNAIDSINSCIYQTEDKISEFEARNFEIPKSKEKSKLNLRDQ